MSWGGEHIISPLKLPHPEEKAGLYAVRLSYRFPLCYGGHRFFSGPA
jgi:hypothetical protein